MKYRMMFLVTALALSACATDQAFREGERLITEGRAEEGLGKLAEAVREHPNRAEYKAALVRAREHYLGRLLREGDAAVAKEQFDLAEERYREVLRQHPENARAGAGLAEVAAMRRNRILFGEAQAAFDKDEIEVAGNLLRSILTREPGFADAAALMRKVDEKVGRGRGVEFPQLAAAYRKRVTLEFRDVPIKTLFNGIARQSGLNFIFDRDVRTDQRSTVFASDTPLLDVLDTLLASNQLAKKVLNANTLLIYPNAPAKLKDYQDVVVRAFFLANADPKQTMNLLRTMAHIRDVHIDEKLNMVVVRDNPESVRLAEKLVRMADQAEPEVMLEVEILEVKRSKLLELGVQWPTQFGLLSKEEQITNIFDDAGNLVSTSTALVDTPLTLSSLETLFSSKNGSASEMVGISPTLAVVANKNDGSVNLLANPRIRVRNKEKARIHIGDKVPVITSNVTATGVTSESVSYLDVGLKLDVEPQIYLDAEVAIKVGLEVSNIVQQVKSGTGTLTYQLGSRNANTVLRLRDGETQVLAGLISDEERSSAAKVPGLGDLPLIGRLFSSNRDDASKTEIVLLITPRIVRNISRPELANGEFYAGTESMASGQPIRLRSEGRLGRSTMRVQEGQEPAAAEAEVVEGVPAEAQAAE